MILYKLIHRDNLISDVFNIIAIGKLDIKPFYLKCQQYIDLAKLNLSLTIFSFELS